METTFNDIPNRIDEIFFEIQLIKTKINESSKKKDQFSKRLNIDNLILFLSENGYQISKSKIYKMSALNQIPHQHFGRKLVFDKDEILRWCQSH